MFEAIRLGTAFGARRFLLLRSWIDKGHHLLVDKRTETEAEVLGYLLHARS